MDGAFHDADGKPGFNFVSTGDRHTAAWIGPAARRSLLALRLIADSERIVGNPYLVLLQDSP